MTHHRLWCQQWQWIDNLSVNWMHSFLRKKIKAAKLCLHFSFPYAFSWLQFTRQNSGKVRKGDDWMKNKPHDPRYQKQWLNILINFPLDWNVNVKNKMYNNSIINKDLQIVDRINESIPENCWLSDWNEMCHCLW